jgi:hypothetical protein
MTVYDAAALCAALVLAGLHIAAASGRSRLSGMWHSGTLSAAAGVSVAYVFVRILPELAEAEESIGEDPYALLPSFERRVYLLALVGMATAYAVEQLSRRSRREMMASHGVDITARGAQLLSFGSYTVFNVLAGYVLVRGFEEIVPMVLFAVAMALHYVVVDHVLTEHHKHAYQREGRWVLAMAILLGYVGGMATSVAPEAVAVLVAFLAGGVIMNVLHNELSEERQIVPFVGAALGYSALLLVL